MKSNCWLTFDDPKLKREFLLKRNKEINIISFMIVLVRVLILIGALVSFYTD